MIHIMKKLLFALVALFISAATVSAQEISVNKDLHDYGTIKQYADGTSEFEISNVGNQPLVITRCQGSCGCTVPECPQVPIAPGKTEIITVKYDTKRLGSFQKSVTITTNDPNMPSKVVKIKGFVEAAESNETSPINNTEGPRS
jgi:hypothetical protein